MRLSNRSARARVPARRLQDDDPERGDVSGWGALAGLATVGTAVMIARYQELLVQTFAKITDATFGGPPGV